MSPSDWFSKALNGQQLGKRAEAGLLGRERTLGRKAAEMSGDGKQVRHMVERRIAKPCDRMQINRNRFI